MLKELDTLRKDIETSLDRTWFVVFHGMPRQNEPLPMIRWDVDAYPDPALFLDAARKLEVRLIVFNHHTFTRQMLESAHQQLEVADIDRESSREFERSLAKLKGFEGFTCSLEMSFDFQSNTYVYEALTPWYSEFLDILGEIDDMEEAGTGAEDDNPLGGYYSQN